MHRPVQRCFRFVCLPVAMLLTTPILGAAQLIYSNGVPDNQSGLDVYDPYRTANDFPLVATTQLGSFEWYALRGQVGGPATISSNFSWTIYNDVGGTVGSTVLGSGTATNATGTRTAFFCCGAFVIYDAYIFSNVSFGGLSLGSGQYWLVLEDYVDQTDPNVGFWATSAQVGNQAYWDPESNSWDYYGEGAFSIYGTETVIPEPGSLALLATGLVGLVPTFRRKLRRKLRL